MFRLVEGAEGSIKVDGVNIAAVPLKTLRKSLAIIPQVPFSSLERCPPRQKSRVERLKAKVEPLLT